MQTQILVVKPKSVRRLVFLPPVPLNAFPMQSFTLTIQRLTVEQAREIVEFYKQHGEIAGYIRHKTTELYKYNENDLLLVVGLKKPVRGIEVEVKPEDLDLALVTVVA